MDDARDSPELMVDVSMNLLFMKRRKSDDLPALGMQDEEEGRERKAGD